MFTLITMLILAGLVIWINRAFEKGLNSAFKQSRFDEEPFGNRLAKGWVRGWLLLIFPLLLSAAILVVSSFLGAMDGGFDTDLLTGGLLIFAGIGLPIMFGLSIAIKISAHYPKTSKKRIAAISATWVLSFFLVFVLLGAAFIKHPMLDDPLQLNLSYPKDLLWIIPFIFTSSLLFSRMFGKDVTISLLKIYEE